jgi:hypothetical protein
MRLLPLDKALRLYLCFERLAIGFLGLACLLAAVADHINGRSGAMIARGPVFARINFA